MALSCDSAATPRPLCVLCSLPYGSMKCTVEVNVRVSLCLGAGLLAVCTTSYRPLTVCLDLHCAPGEAVGVKQQVAGLCLDILPVVGTRGRCEHKNAFEYKSNNLCGTYTVYRPFSQQPFSHVIAGKTQV